jgi:isoquinoline 1-oxidoreductase beta subunit
MTVQTSRRGFLKGIAALSGVALVVGFNAKGALAAAPVGTLDLNPFVKIDGDGVVTVVLKHFEMGQGTSTGLATLVAEELDADWATLRTEFAPADGEKYQIVGFGVQMTGGSMSIWNSYMQYRKAGAAARAMLVEAAAAQWGVAPEAVTVEKGILKAGDHSAGFGAFVDAAAILMAPENPPLKDPTTFALIGKPDLKRRDNTNKTDGTAVFALDVTLPGMVHAVILRPDQPGAMLDSFDASDAVGISGFLDAKALPNKAGVAVFAKSTWGAIQARNAIVAKWDTSAAETRSTDRMVEEHLALVRSEPSYQIREGGDLAATTAVLAGAAKVIEAEFTFPHLAHAPMEPLNCVIEATEAGGVRFHDGCQAPGITQGAVAHALGLTPDKVEVNTVYAGGSFGRRATPTSDYHVEAALAFSLLGGKTPVKLVWTREDDIRGGYYRPMAAHRVKIGLDGDGKLVGWDHRLAVQSIMKGTAFEAFMVQDGVDGTSAEGVRDSHYAIPAMSVGLSDWTSPLKVLWWRSVGHTHTGYTMEVAMDMAAKAAGQDPVAFRLALLEGDDPDRKRLAGVLRLVAEKAEWDKPAAPGRFRGVAVHKSFNTYVAQVAEISRTDKGAIKIEKVVCAIDCGVAVNPDIIKAQMEGGIGFGLGAAMRNQITFTDGAVDQWNFPDYVPLRMGDIGPIEVHVLPSAEAPSGVGEPGLPPSLPAVANAIAAATGDWPTHLPWSENGLTFGA